MICQSMRYGIMLLLNETKLQPPKGERKTIEFLYRVPSVAYLSHHLTTSILSPLLSPASPSL